MAGVGSTILSFRSFNKKQNQEFCFISLLALRTMFVLISHRSVTRISITVRKMVWLGAFEDFLTYSFSNSLKLVVVGGEIIPVVLANFLAFGP